MKCNDNMHVYNRAPRLTTVPLKLQPKVYAYYNANQQIVSKKLI